ncbi:Uncharacterized protein SCF082_LOCUS35320 [Durusdinium trenchii]|uniref:Farnesoic acid O-methyl transferase domain-containing protein n=1 Tax=Durusdinium trenchii TaxID=1381693 RepID=A0ABP0P6P4_9DINO
MNSEAHDCLCQVPTQSDSVGPDGILAPVQDTMWRAPHVGKFCDSMVLDFKINEKEVRTTGYCEWNLHASVPSDSVISLDLSMNDTGAATVSGSVVPDASGKAWTLTGDGHFQLPPTMLSSNYTLVAWVNIPNFIFANASDAATLQLFDAIGLTGNQEPCLQLVQRAEIDATPAFCGGEFLCNSSQHHCCYTGHGTSTTTTSTSTTWVNQTMEDEEKDCQCSCAINMTAEVEAEIGTPIGNHRWALKMRACDSEAAWDSGADLLVDPFTGESAWTMVAAVAEGGITTFYTSEPLKPEIVEYRQLFNCSSPGCQTTVIFRDIPRHPSRTCALDVDVWITDFVNDEHHSNPEVVDLIRVRGGAPVNSREIRRNCHPDGANEPNRLYKCVHKENLDEWILSTSADRALRVDVSITPWVDAYPKDGKYLTGIATVSCALVELPERNLPKSGSIHAVGSVKRSCEGSTLTAIGGAVGATADGMAPSMYLGQAWAFSRMLSKEELMALHLGTRTRYHRDYQIPVQSTEIVNPGVEVVVSGFMQCEFPGCSASVTLTGLPTNGDARCFFTYGVAITDFSGPEEVVEYIRIDEHTVVERCWPQADGNPDTFYLCADKLDVSQSVLRSSFLRDGEVVITAKLSEDVDILDFRYQNRFMLHAEATLQCLGGADKELQQTVLVQPSVTHILATPVNAQGSGPYASTAFFDTSNGFVVPPNIGQASSAALQVNVEGVTNGQFWAFVVYRHLEGVTKEEIYTGAYTSVSLCEAPQRAIGKPTLQDFNADPFLVQCEFEPGIAYTLILYLDAMAEPFGGGEIARVPFIGAMPDTPTTLPLLRARGLAFEDTNPLAAKVYGTLTITSAASEANVTHYHLYYGSFSRIWPDGSEPFAIIPATGAYEYSVLVNTQLLPGANTFLVFCKNSYGEATVSRRLGILDISMILLEDPLIALQYINGNTYLEINSQMSGPGARVDVAVVPEGGESRAQISTDYTQLDFGPLIQSTVCSERDIQYDLTSGSKVIGPCALQPAQAYTVVVYVAIRYECPCQDPCYCTGQMRFQSQAGSGLELSPTNRILLPDHAAPIFTLYPCGASCNLDSKLRLTGHVQDPGTSYPVVTMCAACVPPYNPTTDPIPQAMDPPRTCLRNGDASAHRYWRIRIPQGFACGQNTINILEAEFYEVSPLERTGLKVVPASYLAKVPEIAGADKAAAFDGSQASMYLMDTLFDAWLGIDVGIGQQAAILRFRGFWQPGCVPSKLVLEWSDDIITWTERIITEPDVTQSFTDVYVAANSGNWTLGAFYQVAFTAESEGDLIIDGVTPGSDYNIHCLSTDSAGSSGREQNALAVTTTDLVSPFLTVSNVSATDYTAKVYLDLRDPGKAYPALSTCIARELTGVSQALPPMSELSSQGQKCHYLMVEATHTGDGRVAMQTVFSSRLLDRELRLQQSQWGGHRQDYQSCGFNHEPMAGPGGCSSRGSLQKVSFLLSVKAIRDVYVWIGEIGGLGYEILLGGWQNTRVTLSHGYSRDPSNEGQAPPTVMRAYSSPDEAQILDQNSFLTFWVDADPMTGLIRVGANEIFGHNVLIAYNDSNPISPLTSLMVGTLQSEGAPPQIYVCPRVGNLLQGRSIQSSSVAFNGSPEKAVDGQWGDNTFCEYCARNDPLHVCASTRRQDSFNPPYFRIALGSDRLYLISAIRLVVPTDGRPEQSAEWTIYVGTTGFRSDSVCTVIPNARGDHIWPCTPANGNYVSVWGNVNQLKVLPEEFGIRICEIEAYATYQTTRLEHVIDKFALANGLPQPFPTDGPPQNINIYGLQPNRSYEVFCYSEDLYGNLQYSQSAPLTLKTTDTTAPKLQINHIYPTDLSITVEVGLEDPGDAYPALARCMATQDGRAPQEHDAYFEHRFWRIRFITTYTTLDPSCADRVLLRSLDLQSWLGQTFRRHMFSSDPLLPQDTIGLDTDDNGLIDSFETAAWSVPMEDAWVGIDLQYMPETAARVRSRGFLLEGDLVVGIRWEGNVDDLDLSVVGPGSEYLDFNLTEGDFYRVSDFGLYAVPCNPGDGCTTPVRSSLFVIALAGDYDIMVYRRGEKPWSQLSISAHVRLCGRDIEYQLTLADNEQNDTIASGLRVPFSKCHRKPQSAVQNLRVWQSTVHGGGASVDRMWYLADDNPHSCMETGGEGSPTPDAKPWWRVSLENTQIVQGLWLAGQSGPGVATHADVFTSSSTQKDVSAVVDVDSYNGQIFYVYNATTQYCYRVTIGQQIEEDQQSSVHACDALGFPSNTASNYFLIGSYTSTAQNEQSFENGVTCSKASGHRHGVLNTVIRSDNGALEVTVREIRPCFYEATLHVPLSTILQQGTLCAEDVPIGVLEDPFQVPATRACMQESRGSTVWVVAKYGRLRLCEVELFTEPLPTVTQVSFDYGASGNESVGAVCGANNISIEFSDDNVTWMKAWDAWADASVYQHVQFARWSWWQRLFALPFHTNFSQAESRNVTIPSLRENSSYDVLCWATDAIGNDIMQSMVVLPLPWADTRENVITTPVDYPGVRRLQENNETLRCTGWVREIMPCEEEVATSDRVIPRVVQALLVDVQTTTEGFFTGNTERVSFRMELRDGSCNFRVAGSGTECRVLCRVLEQDLSWLTYGGTCLYPRCDEQAWSNEYPVHLSFGMLQPGEDYTLVCFVTDPWGNEAQQEFTLSIPERTTPAPPSTQSTSQRPQTPAPVTQPPTQPRTTQSVEYYTRAPTVRTTAAASTSMQPPAFTTTDRTWEPRTTEEPTTTTTTTIEPLATLPPWLENYVPAGPLRTEMTLSTSSREDAEELVLPAAMNALKSALRSSLELGPLDKLTIEGTEIYLEGGSGRRLAERWLVRVRFTVEAYNAVQNKALLQRVGQLGLGESSVSSNFQEQLSVELAQRGVPLPVDFVGSIPLQDGEQWSPVPSPSPTSTSSVAASGLQNGGGLEMPDGEGGLDGVIILLTITGILACIGLLVGGAIYAICSAKPPSSPHGKLSKVANSNQALSKAESNPALFVPRTPSGRVLLPDLRETAKAEPQPDSIEEFHRKFRHSPSASSSRSTGRGGAHVVNVK